MYIPKGFFFNGMHAGIKKNGKADLALVYGEKPFSAVCFFTSNAFKAAPLLLSIEKNAETNSHIQAIVVNSGNANCFTGAPGLAAARKTSSAAAALLGIEAKFVHASSTGIIKKPLPVAAILAGLPALVKGLSPHKLAAFNAAIMTTDTFEKIESARVCIAGKKVTICAVAKGAGMIWPQVAPQATMLSYIFTDAAISQALLRNIATGIVEKSFNSVTIDGCTSTNDSVFILCSGASGAPKITKTGNDCAAFARALESVCLGLAKKIARDGEGARKFIEVVVKGAPSRQVAKQAGLAIANSFLFKTAVAGANKNIGRIAQALGQAQIIDSRDAIGISCSDLAKKDVRFVVNLKKGNAQWKVYTCDITEEYVKINAEYN